MSDPTPGDPFAASRMSDPAPGDAVGDVVAVPAAAPGRGAVVAARRRHQAENVCSVNVTISRRGSIPPSLSTLR
ncbi:MAG: hypothetical protein ACYC1Z_11250, partial [Georgenia sp.]